jgi:K+-transporting ATPase ATPase B chain
VRVVFPKLAQAFGKGRGQDEAVVIEDGGVIPCDGTVIDGVALVDESALTGESAPVVRESGGDRNKVIGGTRVLSGKIVIEVRRPSGR